MVEFRRYTKQIVNPFPERKVEKIDFALVMENATGTLHATDIFVQDGSILTGWVHNTKEMLEPITPKPMKYYNAIVRGQKGLYLRNLGDTMGYANWTITADSDLAPPKSTDDYKGLYSMEFGMFYRTRNIRIEGTIKAGDVFKFWGRPETITKNGAYFNRYAGFFLGSPAGDNYFLVSLPGEQPSTDSYNTDRVVPKPNTSRKVRVLIGVTPRNMAEGGKHL